MTILFIYLAYILKAFADAQAHHRYKIRVNGFWTIGGGRRLRWTNYPFDSWHVANSLNGVMWFTAAVFAYFNFMPLFNTWVDLSIGFVTGSIPVFNFFYNKVFK